MNSKTLQKLDYFKGRACSIFTHAIPREFDELRSREHFVVRVLEITPDGVLGEHPYNGTKSFFFADHIQFIQEEVELDPTNPEHFQMMKDYEEKTGKKLTSDLEGGPTFTTKKPEPIKELPVVDSQEALRDPVLSGEDAVFIDIDRIEQLAEESKQRWNSLGVTQ